MSPSFRRLTGALTTTFPSLAVLAGVAAVGLTGATVSASAYASGPPSQSATMHSAFLLTAPAPSRVVAVCLVDTGVNVTPGDQAALLGREAVDGANPDDNVGHGTMLATAMLAAYPQTRLISERVTDSMGTMRMSSVIAAVNRCTDLGASVVNMSVAGPAIGGQEAPFAAAIANAQAHGVVLVAGAGNNYGGAVEYPAALPGVLAVSAADESGSLCPLSARGPQIALSAPGCNLDITMPDGSLAGGEGTSFSSAFVAAAASALRAYSGLDAATTTRVLLGTATPSASGPALNVAAAFTAAGLGALAEGATGARTPANPTPAMPAPGSASGSSQPHRVLLRRPMGGRARWTGRSIVVTAVGVPVYEELVVHARGAVASGQPGASSVTLKVARTRSVVVRLVSASGASHAVRLRVR